ncbi:hypothetical protein OG458_41790 (plasmid) [Streptomyces sp. NBC_01281]|uniref:hypothetical protein n=1 Tax=Streptomyces sp. NBC_01281 TaxID=2903811 RepID=UPI002E14C84A|nr:hypothetical protein OG458_41790 [Streptomyces sp. NBC_01281]
MTPPYEMRPLRTGAERAEAIALVKDRQRWLTLHNLPVARMDVPAVFRDSQAELAGLFEEGVLAACMILRNEAHLEWGSGPCLVLDQVHTHPGRSDNAVRYISLWASDFAARREVLHVRAEALSREGASDPIAPVLNGYVDMGWVLHGYGLGQGGERAARLELRAEYRPTLGALVGCRMNTAQLPESGDGARD